MGREFFVKPVLRGLDAGDFDSVFAAFCSAFEGYSAQTQRPNAEAFHSMLRRRGVRWPLSVGAWVGQDLVGFSLLALDHWDGRNTAYVIVNGVLPAWRGQRLVGQTLELATVSAQKLGAERVTLEVLQNNHAALQAYRRFGFVERRQLTCFELDVNALTGTDLFGDFTVADCRRANWPEWRQFGDWRPSWQNDERAIERDRPASKFLLAADSENTLGYLVVAPATGDVPQFAVRRSSRRRKVATALLQAAARASKAPALRVINVDARASDVHDFLNSFNAAQPHHQFEMEKTLIGGTD